MSQESDKDRSLLGNGWFILGCLAPLSLFTLLVIFVAIWMVWPSKNQVEPPAFIADAAPRVERVQERLAERREKLASDEKGYDLDQTVQALFGIERSLREAKNFEDLTDFILQRDSDKVAPDVARLKCRFFNIYKNMLDARDELEEINSIFNVSTGALLDLVSTVNYPVVSIDHDQAKAVWRKRLGDANLKRDVKNRLVKHQDEMIDFYFDFINVSGKYYKEWNKLCALRDRAYLAVYESDWKEAAECAREAVKMAPDEKEAHVLLAMALLENGSEIERNEARALIDDFLKRHRGQEAPGYLLRGVDKLEKNEYDGAILDFDQAAAYFPKQASVLLDKLNLYKKRQFLNQSKEGRMIINMYRGFMTGSGYFSPDFQKARIHLAVGEKEKAKRKIFDHFFRRRKQGQWDRVLTDFQYCNNFLKTDLFEIFAGDHDAISLEIDSAFFTNSVIVTINNDSDFDLHNATVLLCVRFTDMFKGDYVTFPVGKTVATIPKGESVTVGRRHISAVTKEKLGEEKEFEDIIEYAAVLISDEMITWLEPKAAVISEVDAADSGIDDPTKEKLTDEDLKSAFKRMFHSAVDYFYGPAEAPPGSDAEKNKDVTKKIVNEIVDRAVDSNADDKPENPPK